VEPVFRPEIFRIFSNAFSPVPAGKHKKLVGIHREKSDQLTDGVLLSYSSDLRCFPERYGDFPASFLHDSVAGIIDLDIYYQGLTLYREEKGEEKTEREKKTDVSVHITASLNLEREKNEIEKE
jgi:hypothetical protein